MNQFWWYGLLLMPEILLPNFVQPLPVAAEPAAATNSTATQETQASSLQQSRDNSAPPMTSVESLAQPMPPSPQAKAPVAQVTSVAQLSDVQPTNWAFQAVQFLVERYGCIEGYPDQTFRGNRAATRYELAAALNACLNQVSERFITAEDLATLRALQEEFAAELATLRGRVDTLEARTSELEANQFSTTTKLSALAFFNLTGATAGGNIRREVGERGPSPEDPRSQVPMQAVVEDDPNVTLSGLVWLDLNTSFTGEDILRTELAVGNGNSPANVFASAGLFNTFGVPFTDQTAGTEPNQVTLRELSYSFPASDSLQVVVGPRLNWYRYFDNNRFTFFLTGASSFNSSGGTLVNTIDRGAGAVLLFSPSDKFQFHLGYLGESNEYLPNPPFNSSTRIDQGLFGGTNTLTGELAFAPTSAFNLRLLYTRSNIQQIGGLIGGAIGEPLYGLADDGLGGDLNNATADTYSVNFDWLITPRFGVFGRYTFGSTHLDPATPGVEGGSVNGQSYQVGLGFPDLGKKGALAVLSFLAPFDVTAGRNFLVSGGGDGGTQYDFEASYYYPINDNVALVPAFYTIFNANNFSNNPNIYVGNLRAQFSF